MSRHDLSRPRHDPEAAAWTRGFASALADVWRLHHDGQMVRHLISANGLSLGDIRLHASDFDYRSIVAAVAAKDPP